MVQIATAAVQTPLRYALRRRAQIPFGGITAAAGLFIFIQPGMALVSLTLFLAIYFVVDGIFNIYAGFQLEDGKGWVIFNGVACLPPGFIPWRSRNL